MCQRIEEDCTQGPHLDADSQRGQGNHRESDHGALHRHIGNSLTVPREDLYPLCGSCSTRAGSPISKMTLPKVTSPALI
jgi:hypothetical protein